MSGYSGTPLERKLGMKPGARLAMLGDARIELDARAAESVRFDLRGKGELDLVILLCARRRTLEKYFKPCADRLASNGGLWVGWPKKSSGVETDLGEAAVRAFGLNAGLVDNKVCAIDETWSGLRFVYRLKDRPNR